MAEDKTWVVKMTPEIWDKLSRLVEYTRNHTQTLPTMAQPPWADIENWLGYIKREASADDD